MIINTIKHRKSMSKAKKLNSSSNVLQGENVNNESILNDIEKSNDTKEIDNKEEK